MAVDDQDGSMDGRHIFLKMHAVHKQVKGAKAAQNKEEIAACTNQMREFLEKLKKNSEQPHA